MKAAYLLLFVLICGCAVTLAQQTLAASPGGYGVAGMENLNPAASQPSTVFIVPPAQGCPISMQARQSGMTDLVKVNRGARSRQEPNAETLSRPGQRIELIVPRVDSGNKIIGAVVTVRGLTARARIDRAASGSGAADLRRTLEIAFTPQDDKTISAQLVLPGFTAVKSVKLDSLRYADGSSRDFSGQKLCTVAPDPIMLIAGR
jgi:hypothetical protein